MISTFGARLQGALIENRSAPLVIAEHDCPQTLFYVDPPYLPSTRERGDRTYQHEMSEADHVALIEQLDQLDRVEGAVVLSGYASHFTGPNC